MSTPQSKRTWVRAYRHSFAGFFWLGILPATATLALCISYLGAVPGTVPQVSTKAQERPGETDNHLYAARYVTDHNWKSTLVLNNSLNRPMTANVTLFSPSGEPLVSPEVLLQPLSNRALEIDQIVSTKLRNTFSEGSIEVFFRGPVMGIGAQVMVVDERNSLSYDVPLTTEQEFSSSRLDSLWMTLDHQTQVELYLANTTGEAITVSPTFFLRDEAHKSEPVVLTPHGSIIMDLKQVLKKPKIKGSTATGGITLSHSGNPGALVATGALIDKHKGFSSTLRFSDLSLRRSNALHGAHLPIGRPSEGSGLSASSRFTPNVVLRNTVDRAVKVRAKVPFTRERGSGSFDVATLVMGPDETRRLDLEPVLLSIGSEPLVDSGLEVEHDGPLGAIMGAAISLDQTENQVFDVPLRDPKSPTNAGGSYPWRIDADNRAVLHLKNIDAPGNGELRQAGAMLAFEDGEYVLPVQLIEAGQTLPIDIKRLRDEQLPDPHGNVIPLNVTTGQLTWFGRGELGQFVGRLIQYDPTGGIATSVSCPTSCQCDPSYESGFITPGNADGIAGESIQLRAFERDRACDGGLIICDVTAIASFESSSPSVVSMNGSTALLGEQGGTASIFASWDAVDNQFGLECGPVFVVPSFEQPGGCCNSSIVTGSGFANVTSLQAKISSAQRIQDGETAMFDITVEGGTATSFVWSFTAPSGAGNNPNVTFTPNNSSSTTTNGHWFASPNQECSPTVVTPNATPDCSMSQHNTGAYLDAVYKIKCKVTFSNGKSKTPETTLTVNGVWNLAGFVNPNEARIIGVPAMAADASGVWRVTGMGSLQRKIPTKNVCVPNTSQFFNKTDKHEQEHLDHWSPSKLFSAVHQPTDFFARIQNFTGTSEQDLLNKVIAEFQIYTTGQDTFVQNNKNQSEKLAHQVSDPLSPKFLYQNCGRF